MLDTQAIIERQSRRYIHELLEGDRAWCDLLDIHLTKLTEEGILRLHKAIAADPKLVEMIVGIEIDERKAEGGRP